MKKLLLFSLLFTGLFRAFAQFPLDIISDGALISVYSDSVYIDGNFLNKNYNGNDSIINYGNIYLTGNWSNDSSSGKVFSSGPNGWLHLIGDTQTIGGNALTHFNNLELAGTGLKKLVNINTEIEDTLALNDRIFDAGDNTALILTNGKVNNNGADDFGGYVNSTNNGGLSRETNAASVYEFPVGSYEFGVPRYRPVNLMPASNSPNTFKVRMANVNPTSDSFDVDSMGATLCEVNANFYHRIHHINGTDSADITFYYNDPSDGNFQTIAHWETGTPDEWKNTLNNTTTSGFPLSTVTKTGWGNFSPEHFALAKTSPSAPVIAAIGDTTFCEGGNVTLSVITPADSYSWSNGLTTQNITVTTSGNYSVTVTNANGCSAESSSSVQVTVNNFTPPTLTSSSGSTNICEGISDTLDAGSGFTGYLWSTTETSQIIFINSSGTYTVTVTDANGCSGSDSITISVSAFPDTIITANGATTICDGESVTLDAGSGFSTYQWFLNGDTLTNDTLQSINVDSSGNYTVLVTDGSNCKNDSSQATITVTVNPTPEVTASPDTIIHYGTSGTVTANGAGSYTWFVNGQNVSNANPFTVSPSEETTYMVIGNNGNCADTALVKVSIDTKCVPGVPNIFSPNEDMVNDEFKIAGYGFEFHFITIYDRWGNKVMETSDINTGWNGKINNSGENLNNGVYVYILKYKCLHSGEEFDRHGNVTLTR